MAEAQTTTKEALEPCPLCPDGGKPYFTKSVNGSKMLYVGCSQCGLQLKAMLVMVTPVDEAPTKDIVAIWNTRSRVTTPIVAPEVDWQPAETAPKETEILMAWEDGHLQIVYLKNEPSFWFENEPTHWAPLPAGPSAAPASTVAPVEQSTNTFDYMCDAIPNCGWRSTDTSRPIGNGIKVNCPNCLASI